MLVSPELGAAFLGTRGDEWDAQKDSLLAFAGSIIGMLITHAMENIDLIHVCKLCWRLLKKY
jgi:uncharacterized membrane protein YjdF